MRNSPNLPTPLRRQRTVQRRSTPALALELALVLAVAFGSTLAGASSRDLAGAAEAHPDPGFVSHHGRDNKEQTVANARSDDVIRCRDGMADIYPCKNVDLLAHVPLAELGGGSGADNWGWVDPGTGREYALIGRSTGVSFLDVTTPTQPRVVGRLPRNDKSTLWTDVKVFKDHAFIVADKVPGMGMQVFDLKRLADAGGSPVTFEPDTVYREFASAHNIVINEQTGFAYAVGGDTCASNAHMVDINNPLDPRFAGCIEGFESIHDMQCVVYHGPDSRHAGKEICIANTELNTSIMDVTDKSNPGTISTMIHPNAGFSHQGWLTEDHRFYFLGDELDELNDALNTTTYIFDLENLEEVGSPALFTAETRSTDHNLYIRGPLVFQANYTAGMRILRIDDAQSADLDEVAFFDTYPENDDSGFGGAWNAYPFLPSGNIIISDMNRGVFIVRPTVNHQGQPLEIDFDDVEGNWVTDDQDLIGASQGLMFDYFASVNMLFVGWFTYTSKPEESPAGVGDDVGAEDNRWMTAQLLVTGNSAAGDLFASTGGRFDSPAGVRQETVRVGSMVIDFYACDRATVTYAMNNIDLARRFQIIPLEKRVKPTEFACGDDQDVNGLTADPVDGAQD